MTMGIITTLDENKLLTMADKTRAAIGQVGGLPEYLREALSNAADAFEFAAAGKIDQAAVQSAVDHLNEAFDKRLGDAWMRFDEAESGDDPEAWRDALSSLISVMPEAELRVIKDAFAIVLEHMLVLAVEDFESMEVAGSC